MLEKMLFIASFILFPICTFFYGFVKLMFPGTALPDSILLLQGVLCIVMLVLFFRTISRTLKETAEAQEIEIMKQTLILKEKQNEDLQSLHFSVSRKQAAFIRELEQLEQTLSLRDKDKALLAFHRISSGLTSDGSANLCSDSLLNAVLQNKMTAAENCGIKCQFQIVLPPRLSESVPHTVLICIFSNLMDNAVKACQACTEGVPFIRLKTGFHANILYIEMKNSKSPLSGDIQTAHSSPEHGLGLSIMEEAVRKYHGTCEWTDLRTEFCSVITLQF